MRGHTRGQTTLDFAFGMSLFLAVVLFVFLFVPGVVEPFTAGAQEETVAVDRVADDLSRAMLGSAERPKVLNATCTAAFFDNRSESGCHFAGETTNERLGLDGRQRVNVTVTRNGTTAREGASPLCWDADAAALRDQSDCESGDVSLQVGEPTTDDVDESVTARRVVSLHREVVTLEVVLW
ncbi:hypothetical protein GOC74_10890 [Halomicrobium mukohataei]|uniref:Uncharacterized protein n=2 Tax=Halomicrobium mukohataei TaxID=57705 RepID=A0A847UG19_9EURY|nr:hypothetical protein [Halomicrobium mukohataei]